jgi:hypothetical protein
MRLSYRNPGYAIYHFTPTAPPRTPTPTPITPALHPNLRARATAFRVASPPAHPVRRPCGPAAHGPRSVRFDSDRWWSRRAGHALYSSLQRHRVLRAEPALQRRLGPGNPPCPTKDSESRRRAPVTSTPVGPPRDLSEIPGSVRALSELGQPPRPAHGRRPLGRPGPARPAWSRRVADSPAFRRSPRPGPRHSRAGVRPAVLAGGGRMGTVRDHHQLP